MLYYCKTKLILKLFNKFKIFANNARNIEIEKHWNRVCDMNEVTGSGSWCDAEEALFNSHWTGILTEWNTIYYSTENVTQNIWEKAFKIRYHEGHPKNGIVVPESPYITHPGK